VLVADKRRKDTRSIPRPWDDAPATPMGNTGLTADVETGVVTAVGYKAMLAATQMRGAVKLG
jgi:hypothetical protein